MKKLNEVAEWLSNKYDMEFEVEDELIVLNTDELYMNGKSHYTKQEKIETFMNQVVTTIRKEYDIDCDYSFESGLVELELIFFD